MVLKLLSRLWIWANCWDACPYVFHHKSIRVVQQFRRARKLKCDLCGKYFAMSDEFLAVLPWDEEFEDLYSNRLGYGKTNQ